MATFTLPPNDNGKGYVCFSRTGYGQSFSLQRRTTTQTFFGAADLDTNPAHNQQQQAGRVWCQQGTELELKFAPDTTGWTATSQIALAVLDSDAKVLANLTHSEQAKSSSLKAVAGKSGWHTLRLSGQALPAAGSAYEITVTYTGTQGLQ
jgi:hypothetical protein